MSQFDSIPNENMFEKVINKACFHSKKWLLITEKLEHFQIFNCHKPANIYLFKINNRNTRKRCLVWTSKWELKNLSPIILIRNRHQEVIFKTLFSNLFWSLFWIKLQAETLSKNRLQRRYFPVSFYIEQIWTAAPDYGQAK